MAAVYVAPGGGAAAWTGSLAERGDQRGRAALPGERIAVAAGWPATIDDGRDFSPFLAMSMFFCNLNGVLLDLDMESVRANDGQAGPQNRFTALPEMLIARPGLAGTTNDRSSNGTSSGARCCLQNTQC